MVYEVRSSRRAAQDLPGRVSLSESVFPAVPLAIDPVFVGSDHGSFAARIRRSRPVRVSLPVANFRPRN